jgi:hypothetical protein
LNLRNVDGTKLLSLALVNTYGPLSLPRKWVSRFDTYETRSARRLTRELRSGGPEVLYLGDSTNYAFVADGNIRPVVATVRKLVPSRSIFFLGNAGYHAALWDAYLSLVERTEVRPVILISLVSRMYVETWRKHPAYTYALEAESIRGLDPTRGVPRMPRPQLDSADFTEFRELQYKTLLGEFPVGHYLKQLRRTDISEQERMRWWYAYLHGAEITGGSGEALTQLAVLGRTMSRLGVPVIAYQGPICTQVGAELLGPEFVSLTERNFDLVASTFAEAVGERCQVLETGMIFKAAEFNDPTDGVEHLNGVGRGRLAGIIAGALGPQLAATRS